MIKSEEVVNIGKFQKTHALKGELNMISEINSDYFSTGKPLIVEVDGILVPFYIESDRPKGATTFLIKLQGINSEEEAREFVNKEVYALNSDIEEYLQEDFVDEFDLYDYKVIDILNGNEIGKVVGIEDSTSNEILIVEGEEDEELYIPFNEELIEEINEEEKIIKMKLPEGLLDIN